MAAMLPDWTPSDWRTRPALQQPDYARPDEVEQVLASIRRAGPLVSPAECLALRHACADAAGGHSFILQAGDCAESLDSDPAAAADAMSAIIERLSSKIPGPVVQIARIAGQFAKPRSRPIEQRGGLARPVYRGDAINGLEFTEAARVHDPSRLILAYRHAAATLSRLRERAAPLFTSHEALLLAYEEALAVQDSTGSWWAGSGHMVWIGERTRQTDGAHVAFAAGIGNVVGVKCGPSMQADDLIALADLLDNQRNPGKLMLIGRFGAGRIGQCLPPLLRAARREGLAACWTIDPMHGNTRILGGRKQRAVADIASEVDAFFDICRSEGVVPAGLHLEIAAGQMAECIDLDGADPMAEFPCDPRLNEAQAGNIVALAARRLRTPAAA